MGSGHSLSVDLVPMLMPRLGGHCQRCKSVARVSGQIPLEVR